MVLLRVAFVPVSVFFFFNDTATTEIYTLSLHDALPISRIRRVWHVSTLTSSFGSELAGPLCDRYLSCGGPRDRKSTRLNSSHGYISYAVFCLKKKKETEGACLLCASRRIIQSAECVRHA